MMDRNCVTPAPTSSWGTFCRDYHYQVHVHGVTMKRFRASTPPPTAKRIRGDEEESIYTRTSRLSQHETVVSQGSQVEDGREAASPLDYSQPCDDTSQMDSQLDGTIDSQLFDHGSQSIDSPLSDVAVHEAAKLPSSVVIWTEDDNGPPQEVSTVEEEETLSNMSEG